MLRILVFVLIVLSAVYFGVKRPVKDRTLIGVLIGHLMVLLILWSTRPMKPDLSDAYFPVHRELGAGIARQIIASYEPGRVLVIIPGEMRVHKARRAGLEYVLRQAGFQPIRASEIEHAGEDDQAASASLAKLLADSDVDIAVSFQVLPALPSNVDSSSMPPLYVYDGSEGRYLGAWRQAGILRAAVRPRLGAPPHTDTSLSGQELFDHYYIWEK